MMTRYPHRACSLAALLTLALIACPAASATVSKAKPAGCRPGHAHLLAADTQAEVYEAGYSEEGKFHPQRIVGCVYGKAHSYTVGYPSFGSGSAAGGSTVQQLVGTMVAVASSYESTVYGIERDSISVRNVRTGRVVFSSATGPPEDIGNSPASAYESEGAGPVASLVLKADGAVAWIVSARTAQESTTGKYQVYTLDRTGKHMVAFGDTIEPASLALAASTIYWTQDGIAHSASLD